MGFNASILSGKAYILMVLLQFGYAGMYIIAVFSLKRGMSHYILVVYRNISATIFMAPLAYWFERKVRPRMTRSCFFKIVALGLLEPVLDQNCYYVGAKLTSASFTTALVNVLPAMTFVLAVILRMEKIKLKSIYTQAKIVGTVITVAGALVMIMYQGPNLKFPWIDSAQQTQEASDDQNGGDFVKGTIFLLTGCVCWASFFVLQSNTLESYPASMSLTTWICLMGSIQSSILTMVMERGSQVWVIGWDMRLFTAVYSGVICSGIAYYVQGYVMKERGPVFVTAFSPLCMIIVAISGSIILKEQISLGKFIGAMIIVVGLYALIWAKSKDFALEKLPTNISKNMSTIELPAPKTINNHDDTFFQTTTGKNLLP